MHTLASARAWAIDELRNARVNSFVLSSDLLLGFVIGRDRVYILSHTGEDLPVEAWQRYRDYVSRHAKGEPLQYLTGEREFYGLEFRVTPSVLIPRPETEILVEAAIRIIGDSTGSTMKYVDIGTGSGCIAVSVAYALPQCVGFATDISASAIDTAKGNAARHHVRERVQFVQTDLLGCFSCKPIFDLILCNPPYVPLQDCDTLSSGVRDYEPYLALFGGPDGLDVFRRLAPEVSSRLKTGGFALLEIGAEQSRNVSGLMEAEGLAVLEVLKDLQGIPRCLICRKN